MVAGIQSLLTVLYSFYNGIFQPLLLMGPYVSLGFFSSILAGIFTLVHWHLLDIEKAEEIKDKLSEHQDKMKEARDNDESDKASDHMQETMKLNQKLMKLNLRPMVGTMLFVVLIFPWLGATYAPAVDMNKTSNHTFNGELEYAGQSKTVTVDNSTDIPRVTFNGKEAEVGETIKVMGVKWQVAKFGEKTGGFLGGGGEGYVLKLNAEFIKLPFSLPYIGGALNWLGFYIVIAMPLTYIMRKVLGVA